MKVNKNILFVLVTPIFFIQAINIDTRVGQAQQHQSYFYDTPQLFNNGDATYGDVAFAKGIVLTGGAEVTLGISQPLSGALRMTGINQAAAIDMPYDLILNMTSFQIAPGSTIGFFSFSISPYPSTLFLTRDITIPTNVTMVVSTDSGGILDGNGNNIIFGGGSFATNSNPSSVNPAPPPMTIKNVTLTGAVASNIVNGSAILENVAILSPTSELLAAPFFFAGTQFTGLNNVLGAGGIIGFIGEGNPNFSYVRIASQSSVFVTPNTTLALSAQPNGVVPAPTGLGFYFTDNTSQLILDNCTVALGGGIFTTFGRTIYPGNFTFTAGTVIVNGNVRITPIVVDNVAVGKGSTLQFGDGVNQANNCDLIILPGSKLIIDNGITFSNKNV